MAVGLKACLGRVEFIFQCTCISFKLNNYQYKTNYVGFFSCFFNFMF